MIQLEHFQSNLAFQIWSSHMSKKNKQTSYYIWINDYVFICCKKNFCKCVELELSKHWIGI